MQHIKKYILTITEFISVNKLVLVFTTSLQDLIFNSACKNIFISFGLILIAVSCARETEDKLSLSITQLTSLNGNENDIKFSPDSKLIAFISSQLGGSNIYVVPTEGGELIQLTNTKGENSWHSWSPDGKTLAFQSNRIGTYGVWVVSSSGGEPRLLSDSTFESGRPKWSPDGSEIAYHSNISGHWNIWAVSIQTGETRQLTDQPDDEYIYGWSPDGSQISYYYYNKTTDHWDIWTVSSSTGKMKQLTQQSGKSTLFGWSSDGAMLGYNYEDSTHRDLYIVSINGTPPKNVTNHEGEEWHPSWSPDGKHILFYTTWNDAMTDIWMTDPVSGQLTQVTKHVDEDYYPRWSPDGEWVVFKSKRKKQIRGDLFLTSVTSGEIVPLNLSDTIDAGIPVWSTNGEAIAFSANAGEEYIYSVPNGGGNPSRLTSYIESESDPMYSSKGNLVVFQSTRFGSENDMFIYNIKEDKLDTITNSYVNQRATSWSPDGEKIGFIRNRGGGPRTMNLWTMMKNGQNQVQISETGGIRNAIWCEQGETFVYSYDDNASYRYTIWKIPARGGAPEPLVINEASQQPTDCSPDGKTFLFQSNMSGTNKIYYMSVSGGDYVEIINELGGGEGGRWSPDGSLIAFLSNKNKENTTDLYVMSSKGGAVTRLSNSLAKESWPSWAADGKSIIYSANMGDNDIWIVDVDKYAN